MIVLGVHFDTHDSGIALVRDGVPLYCSAEERLSRIKQDSEIPLLALRDCFSTTGYKPEDLDFLAISGLGFPKNLFRYSLNRILMASSAYGMFGIKKYSGKLSYFLGLDRLRGWLNKFSKLRKNLKGFKGVVKFVDHEISHAYSALLTSGIAPQNCISFVVEGSGWDKSSSVYVYNDYGKHRLVGKSGLLHSAGYFYDMVTELLGYRANRDAGKITGLAARGNPEYLYDYFRKMFSYSKVKRSFLGSNLIYHNLAQKRNHGILPKEVVGVSPEHVAAAAQACLEDAVVEMISDYLQHDKREMITLSGGTFGNVRLNQRIMESFPSTKVYIHPAMNDQGCALGSALFIMLHNGGIEASKFPRIGDLFLGQDISEDDAISEATSSGLKIQKLEDPNSFIAGKLAEGKSVAVCRGRCEYGPRALGNRSILYRANDISVTEWLNAKLDRAEIMPFAPIILDIDFQEYFEVPNGHEIFTEEFMTVTYNCKQKLKEMCPAIVHIDGTARPQVVIRERNPELWDILEKYRSLTGIPCLINTSYNMHNEPIVGSAFDAVRSFKRSKLDLLLLGRYCLWSD